MKFIIKKAFVGVIFFISTTYLANASDMFNAYDKDSSPYDFIAYIGTQGYDPKNVVKQLKAGRDSVEISIGFRIGETAMELWKFYDMKDAQPGFFWSLFTGLVDAQCDTKGYYRICGNKGKDYYEMLHYFNK